MKIPVLLLLGLISLTQAQELVAEGDATPVVADDVAAPLLGADDADAKAAANKADWAQDDAKAIAQDLEMETSIANEPADQDKAEEDAIAKAETAAAAATSKNGNEEGTGDDEKDESDDDEKEEESSDDEKDEEDQLASASSDVINLARGSSRQPTKTVRTTTSRNSYVPRQTKVIVKRTVVVRPSNYYRPVVYTPTVYVVQPQPTYVISQPPSYSYTSLGRYTGPFSYVDYCKHFLFAAQANPPQFWTPSMMPPTSAMSYQYDGSFCTISLMNNYGTQGLVDANQYYIGQYYRRIGQQGVYQQHIPVQQAPPLIDYGYMNLMGTDSTKQEGSSNTLTIMVTVTVLSIALMYRSIKNGKKDDNDDLYERFEKVDELHSSLMN